MNHIRGVLSDHGYFYLGTVIDGARSRGVGAGGAIVAPQFIRHVIYMQDTDLLLSIDPDRNLPSPHLLALKTREVLGSDYEITYHEIGSLVTGLLSGDITYMDWTRLPIIDQPEPEYVRQILNEFDAARDECYLALIKNISDGIYQNPYWMPLDYRLVQMLVFARTGKIEVNYFTALDYLREQANGYEVYPNAMAKIKLEHLIDRLRSIESSARRGIL